jgi:hypothetical protein
MEVIAGEERYETEVSQHGTRFRLDFSKVCTGVGEGSHGCWRNVSGHPHCAHTAGATTNQPTNQPTNHRSTGTPAWRRSTAGSWASSSRVTSSLM